MLVQVMALLSLGVLCSSAPMKPTQLLRQDPGRGPITQELLEDAKRLNLSGVPRLRTPSGLMERCMHSYLKTFVSALADLNTQSKNFSRKLHTAYESIIPKDLDEECLSADVPTAVFQETLETFLNFLYEKHSDA